MSAPPVKHPRRNLQDPRKAKTNYLYTSASVISHYGICANTLTNWVQRGLVHYQSGRKRLFKGEHLNAFHLNRLKNAKRGLELHEVYCVTCKDIHSLLGSEIHTVPFNGRMSVSTPCPKRASPAYKSMSIGDYEALQVLRKPIPERSQKTNNDSGASSGIVIEEVFSDGNSRPPHAEPTQSAVPLPSKAIQSSNAAKVHVIAVPSAAETANVFAIYEYQMLVKEARGRHDKTVDAILRHIWQFVDLAGKVDFREVDKETIALFKSAFQEKGANGKARAAQTVVHAFTHLKGFFEWLAEQPGYGRVPSHLHDYFTPPRRLVNIANAPNTKEYPSHEEIVAAVESMPCNSFLERRNRAMLAFAYLSGVRVAALITLQIKHVDLKLKTVEQLAAEVDTKNSKTMHSDWFPVGEMFEAIVSDWITDLKAQGATGETPLFPRGARYAFGARNGSGWEPLKDEGTVAKIFARVAVDSGIDHFTPHRVRDTIGSMIFRWASNLEEAKALSQGIGHDNLKTTLDHYGAISEARQHELFSGIRDRSELQFGINTRSLTPKARVQLQQTVEEFIAKMMSMLKME